MGLFSRDETGGESILRRIEGRDYATVEEKKSLLELLRAANDLRAERIVELLGSPDSDLARLALDAVPGLREPRLAELLFAALLRAAPGRGRGLLLAIQKLPAPALSERLRQLLGAKRPEQRALVLEILGLDPRWIEQLHLVKALLRDEEERIRVQAVQLLRRDARDPAAQALLRELLHLEDDPVRHAAIEILAQNPTTDLVEDFFDRIPVEPPRLQELMLRGLGRMVSKGGAVAECVLERMMPLLAAEDERIRAAAAQLLATMPDRIHVLRRFLQYSKGVAFWLRDRGFTAISTVAENLADALLELLRDDDVDVVVGALVMAGRSKDPRAASGIIGVLARPFDWWVKVPALESLVEMPGPEVTEALARALDDPDLRCAAMATIAKRGEAASLERVHRFLDHPERAMRLSAVSACAAARDPRAVPLLERVARTDADFECRFRAIEALDGLGAEGVAAAAQIRDAMAKEAPDVAAGVTLTMLPRELD